MPREASPTDYLAAERTFLAWIRTGVALMGFGFVVALLSVLEHIRQIKILEMDPSQLKGVSVLGIVVACLLALIGCAMAFYVIPKH